MSPIELIFDAVRLLALTACLGGMAYYLIAIAAARRLLKRSGQPDKEAGALPPMSLLKPLGGVDPFLKQQLESFFQQDYPCFEILFAVRHLQDPAAAVVKELVARYPHIPTQLVVAADPPYANAKVYSMERMAKLAQYDILVISDADASVASDYLQELARDFESDEVGAVTNLYRGVAGPDFWSKLEALGMSTEFMAGVIVAEWLEGMKFVLGPSMAVRRKCLEAIGGFAALAEYLADDFVLGERVAHTGYRVILSTHVINHHASAPGFVNSLKHRLRWNRSSRFSRPLGYLGQGFTYGLAWAIVFYFSSPSPWSVGLLAGCLGLRMWLALELGTKVLKDEGVLPRIGLIPLQDVLSFVSWVGGFLGREITWRGIRYRLLEGGRFAPLHPHASIQSHRGMNQP